MMEVANCMKRNVVSLRDNATTGEAATLFADNHVGTLPIIDEQRWLGDSPHSRFARSDNAFF